jgi:shikimate dehydrogenase
MTTRFAVVGSPISHTLSPLLHNKAYKFLNLDFQYGSFDVPEKNLSTFVSTSGLKGLSVTMPLKREAFEFASRVESEAALTRVVNTLVLVDNEWVGHNTDVYGISKALSKVSSAEQIHILGSGSTATSAVLALSKLYPGAKLCIMARNEQQSKHLKDFGEELGLACELSALDAAATLDSDLVLSFVPSGVLDSFWREISESRQQPRGVLFDSSYNPWPSAASSSWRSESISGIDMLIWQAVAQVELFVDSQGLDLSVDQVLVAQVMYSAIKDR